MMQDNYFLLFHVHNFRSNPLALILLIYLNLGSICSAKAEILELNYTGFSVWLDCEKRGSVRFEYTAQADSGSLPRKNNFTFDPDIEDRCQQKSTKSYGHQYDRGQLVPANHLDHSVMGIKESNMITNVLPQARNMNRGAWLLTEEITECIRDIEPLHVIGGVMYGFNPHDDILLLTHRVQTPDYFWKVIIRQDSGDAIAWVIPNSSSARRSQLNQYLIRIGSLEEAVGEKFPVDDVVRYKVLERSWAIPSNCDRS